MAASIVCGDSCTVTCQGGAAFYGHKVAVSLDGNAIDTRCFGNTDVFGSYTTCQWSGTITINSYANIPNQVPPAAVGGAITGNIVITSGNQAMTFNNSPLVSVKRDIDSKGLEEFTYEFRVIGNPTIA